MTEIYSGKLGAESGYELDIKKGNLVASLSYNGVQLDGKLELNLDVVSVLEIIKQKIPGSIDDAIISFVEEWAKAQV